MLRLQNMSPLENSIMAFKNWSQPWTFYDAILNSSGLNEADKELFKTLWAKAADSAIWNHPDLAEASKSCVLFVKENYALSDDASAAIARALSYNWK